METISTAEKIKRMESELAELKRQQAAEIRAVKQAESEKRKQELNNIKEQIEVFNTKYGTEFILTTRNSLILSHCLGW